MTDSQLLSAAIQLSGGSWSRVRNGVRTPIGSAADVLRDATRPIDARAVRRLLQSGERWRNPHRYTMRRKIDRMVGL